TLNRLAAGRYRRNRNSVVRLGDFVRRQLTSSSDLHQRQARVCSIHGSRGIDLADPERWDRPTDSDTGGAMNSQAIAKTPIIAAMAFVFAGCSGMSHTEKDTTVGATGGAVAGAVVAGPVGAVVGGVGGAVVGHEVGKEHTAQGRPGVTGPNPPVASNAPYSS